MKRTAEGLVLASCETWKQRGQYPVAGYISGEVAIMDLVISIPIGMCCVRFYYGVIYMRKSIPSRSCASVIRQYPVPILRIA